MRGRKRSKFFWLGRGLKRRCLRHDACPHPDLRRISLAEVDYADDDAHGCGDIADLAEVSWAADLLEAEEHEEHHGGDHELQGDQVGDAGERRAGQWFRSGIDRKGEEGHGGEIGVGGKFPGTGAEGPGHGAVDISGAEKNRNEQGQQNPRVPPPLKSVLREKMMIPAPARPTTIPKMLIKVWRAHTENYGEKRCHHRREREHDGGKAAADFRDHRIGEEVRHDIGEEAGDDGEVESGGPRRIVRAR